MSALSKAFRRQLENAVLKARDEAERGAAAALESYGVADAKLPGHLDDAGKELRRKLRAHGRQVGDVRQPDDSQEVEHLIHECAYEHWHRMLFARFLAENGFLIEPESGLDVDFAHCEDEGKRLGIDPWEMAARFAQRMLPGIFRPDDPVLQLRLPAESRNQLTALLASLPREVFLADDSLGWVYQFWQAKKKDEVNASGEKIGADELSAVTQLFTEDYMVDFLLDNTLGAWWAGKKLYVVNAKNAEFKSEEEMRQFCALPGCPWIYLRFIKGKDGKWTPVAGTFDGWPKTAKELKCLDPCCGSGHFIVGMFVRLVALRMVEEGLDGKAAVAAVIGENVFGLELDPRCTQIGAFSLALAAWKLGGYQNEMPLNLACSGLGLNTKKEDWVKLAEGNPNLRFAMGALYELFQKAPVLGSLINPRRDKSITYSATLHELEPLLTKALLRETGDDAHELAVTAQGVAKAAEILAGQFTLVATNVPYLGMRKQDAILRDFCDRVHPDARADLATCFGTTDNPRFVQGVWEQPSITGDWETFQSAAMDAVPVNGYSTLLRWGGPGSDYFTHIEALKKENRIGGGWQAGGIAWARKGFAVNVTGTKFVTHFSQGKFDTTVGVIIPNSHAHEAAILCYLQSPTYTDALIEIDPTLSVTEGTLIKVPFDLAHWQKMAAEKYPTGLPKPFSSNPTQWLFNGHPKGSDHPLQVAVARLLGYRWPRQTGSSFPDCSDLEPDGLEKHADNDGIVCFSQARDEAPAATRLRALLADAYGKEWSHGMERKLIAATSSDAESLEEWLLNDFFAQHCDLFHNRPFVWHIWDGRKDGFNVLVNYHRLAGPKGEGHRTLETLTYAYLGDWITRQKDAVAHSEAGADDRHAAAVELQGELKKILAGEPPYDLFIRWKPLHQQPIGWNADINDGVRLNIRPFMVATLSRGKKGCGLFRAKPGSSLKWDKDRGKEPKRPKDDFPWFWSWDEQTEDFAGNGEFDGNRWNDCHYTTAFKKTVCDRKKV